MCTLLAVTRLLKLLLIHRAPMVVVAMRMISFIQVCRRLKAVQSWVAQMCMQ